MALTKGFNDLVQRRAENDAAFSDALPGEEINTITADTGETGNSSAHQSVESTDQGDEEFSIDKLVADIVSKKVSVFDLLRDAPSGDYFAFVQRARLFSVLSKDMRILEHLQVDFRRNIGGGP